jgi:hypothetical protein
MIRAAGITTAGDGAPSALNSTRWNAPAEMDAWDTVTANAGAAGATAANAKPAAMDNPSAQRAARAGGPPSGCAGGLSAAVGFPCCLAWGMVNLDLPVRDAAPPGGRLRRNGGLIA